MRVLSSSTAQGNILSPKCNSPSYFDIKGESPVCCSYSSFIGMPRNSAISNSVFGDGFSPLAYLLIEISDFPMAFASSFWVIPLCLSSSFILLFIIVKV